MKIISLCDAPRVPIHLEGYKMHSSSSLDVIHLCLQPGQNMPQHTNQSDVVACLIKGEVTLNTREDKILLSLYDTVDIENNTDRGFANIGTEEARLIIMKKL